MSGSVIWSPSSMRDDRWWLRPHEKAKAVGFIQRREDGDWQVGEWSSLHPVRSTMDQLEEHIAILPAAMPVEEVMAFAVTVLLSLKVRSEV